MIFFAILHMSIMGLTHCYKTTAFYIYICSFSTEFIWQMYIFAQTYLRFCKTNGSILEYYFRLRFGNLVVINTFSDAKKILLLTLPISRENYISLWSIVASATCTFVSRQRPRRLTYKVTTTSHFSTVVYWYSPLFRKQNTAVHHFAGTVK